MDKCKINPSAKKLGKVLKKLRAARGISLNLFAYENDLSTATVSRVENGIVDTKFSTLIKYADALEINIADIFAMFKNAD